MRLEWIFSYFALGLQCTTEPLLAALWHALPTRFALYGKYVEERLLVAVGVPTEPWQLSVKLKAAFKPYHVKCNLRRQNQDLKLPVGPVYTGNSAWIEKLAGRVRPWLETMNAIDSLLGVFVVMDRDVRAFYTRGEVVTTKANCIIIWLVDQQLAYYHDVKRNQYWYKRPVEPVGAEVEREEWLARIAQ